MREEIVGIPAAEHTLAAAITFADCTVGASQPSEQQPASHGVIIFFAGSGPIDRNENLPRFAMNIFNTLAEQFAAAGYASVRYDKRGCGASGGDYITAGHSDLVNDAVTVTEFVHGHDSFQGVPVYLLGHSEGTVIAAQVASRLSDRIPPSGLLLLCPFAQPMRNVLLQQAINRTTELEAMSGIAGIISKALVGLRGGYTGIQAKFLKRIDDSTGDTVNVGKATLNAKWYREMLALDVVALWQSVSLPTFALGAGKDAQCDPEDTLALSTLITKAPVHVQVEENLTHILRCDSQEPGTGRYPELVKQPIEPLVAERCIEWLNKL